MVINNYTVTGLLLISLMFAGCRASSIKLVNQPGQHPQTLEKKIAKVLNMKYFIYLPQGYKETKENFPTILFLHGSGQKGDDLEMVKEHGLPKILEEKENFPFIVISPQCPKSEIIGWNTEVLIYLLDEIIANCKVDEDRIYLTGLSMGGRGTWSLAIEHPERFAAIAPVCGYGIPFLTGTLKDLPIWVFHGAKDETVPLQNSLDMVNSLKRKGAKVKHTIYPEAGHDAWAETYNNPELYEWFLQHRRQNNKK